MAQIQFKLTTISHPQKLLWMSVNDLNDHADPIIKSPRSQLAMFRTGITQKQLEYVPLVDFIQKHPNNRMIAETLFKQNQEIRKQCIEMLKNERSNIISNGIYEEEHIIFPSLPKSMVKRTVELEGFLRYAGNDIVYPPKVVEKKDLAIWKEKQDIKEQLLNQAQFNITQKCEQMYERTQEQLKQINEAKKQRLQEFKQTNVSNAQRHVEAREQFIKDSMIPLNKIMDPVNAAYENHKQQFSSKLEEIKQRNQYLEGKQQQMIQHVESEEKNYIQRNKEANMARTNRFLSLDEKLRTSRLEQTQQRKQMNLDKMSRTLQQGLERYKQQHEELTQKVQAQWQAQKEELQRCRSKQKRDREDAMQRTTGRIDSVLSQSQQIKTDERNQILEKDKMYREKQENAIMQKTQKQNEATIGYLDRVGQIRQRQLMSQLQVSQSEYQKKLLAVRLQKVKSMLQ